ncbi:MAG TPA: tetratricopeptide repeat protein [Bellilinea sp.]|nr:tetratricopeptide repeat protein [Bellilinea sp.]
MELSIPITRTKLIIPRRRGELLSRPRLLSVLEEAIDNRLIIVAAPAGYGKTSLLVDFVHQTLQPVCWLSLDDLDRDPQRFIAHFIAGIQATFPNFGHNCMPALQGMTQARLNLDALVSLIINDIYETITEHYVFVLDDYHLVEENPDINYFINRFIMTADENSHLVISSRRLLPLADMPLLVARSTVGGLGFEDLAFRVDEIQNLYMQNHRVVLGEPEAAELARLTEGWITGLVLSTDIENGRVTTRVRGNNVTGVGLYEYLAHQVLEHQSPEIQRFLFRSSLLEEFDAERCAAVIGKGLKVEADWQALMDEVQRHNLFTLPVVEDHIWLRYHHLFRDFLQTQMSRLYPEETRKIYLELADYHQQKEDWERAYQICERLGDDALTVEMIGNAGQKMISQGRLVTLNEWIEKLPGQVVDQNAALLSILGAARMMLGDPKAGIRLTTQALELLTTDSDSERMMNTYVRRSTANRMGGNFQQAIEDADQAISLAKSHPELQLMLGNAVYAKGAVLLQTGKLSDAKDSLEKARNIFVEEGYLEGASKVGLDLGLAMRYLGQFNNAEATYRDVLTYYQSTGNVVWQANLLNNLGVLHHLIGDYERALEELEQAIQYARLGGYHRLEAFALTSLGDLFRNLKSQREAEQAYQQAAEIDRQIDDQFLHFYLVYTNAELALDRNAIAQAQDSLESAEAQATDAGSLYELNLCRMLSGRIAFEKGDFASSGVEISHALEFFISEGHIVEANRCRLLLAAASAQAGQYDLTKSTFKNLSTSTKNPEFTNLLISDGKILTQTAQNSGIPTQIRQQFEAIVELENQIEQKLPAIRKQLRRQSKIVSLSPPELTFTTFGKVQIRLGDHLITGAEWMSQNARDLLLLLVLHPEGMTKEEIGEIFWVDSTPAELKLRFKNTIYRLRHAAGKDAVLFEDEIYTFNRGMDYEADFENFSNSLRLAKRAHTEEERMMLLKSATKIYKGYFAPDVAEHWAIMERERFHQQAMEATVSLAELQLKRGEINEMLATAQSLLDFEPTHEVMVCLAMRAQAARGNLTAVMQQYDQFKRVLYKEMGARPSPQTRTLFENLTRARRVTR